MLQQQQQQRWARRDTCPRIPPVHFSGYGEGPRQGGQKRRCLYISLYPEPFMSCETLT